MGFSCRGKVVNLKYQGAGSGINIEDYTTTHYIVGTEKVGIQLPIKVIKNMSLNIVVLVLTRIIGLTSLHQALRPLILYSVEFLQPTLYD
jgi:hypothetical protein